MIEVLKEQHLHRWNRTRCQGDVGLTTQRWRAHTRDPSPQCKMVALYRVDSVPLCRGHCGDELIARALKEQDDG